MSPLVIVNPRSCRGKTERRIGEIERAVTGALGPVALVVTERPRHAVELAEKASREGRDLVVAVGGDGTLHEVVNGLMRARGVGANHRPRLGLIGQGTGGDFRKTLGMGNKLESYCRAIASGKTRTVDVGRFCYATEVGDRATAYFVNILSVGMGGLADRHVARASRALGGTAAYYGACARALLESRVGTIDCTLDDGAGPQHVELRTRSVAICNGQYFGGGMHVAPMAQPDDGRLHVVSLGASGRLGFLRFSFSIYSGTHVDHPDVTVRSCRSIRMALRTEELRDRFPLDVDGEPFGLLPIEVDVVPAALDVLVGDARAG